LDQEIENTPFDELVVKDLENAIKISIESLPEQCRIIFNLSRFSGLSNPEIAEKLGLSPKTVENQITIAIMKIRKFLHQHWYAIILIFFWGCFIFHLTN
jgi:RNA polymerase sigma-70 factor (ECF subfamily)